PRLRPPGRPPPANPGRFLTLPMTASVWFALRAIRADSRAWWLAAGAAAVAACWFKQVAATQIGFLALLAAGHAWRTRRPISALALDAASFIAGAVAAVAPVAAFFALRGACTPFIECVCTHNISY